MDQISRFVVWICSKFNREQIEKIVQELTDILKNKSNLPSKPKDVFKRPIQRYNAILYCQDESTIRLTAVLAKTWSPCGQTPIQNVTGNRGSIAAMPAISRKWQLVFNDGQELPALLAQG